MAVLPLARPPRARDDPAMFIEVTLYDGFDELDGLAPYEVFRTAEALGAPIRAELVGAHGAGTITASHGARVVVDRGPSSAADMVVVPTTGSAKKAAIVSGPSRSIVVASSSAQARQAEGSARPSRQRAPQGGEMCGKSSR